jgi:hypothetical protein
MTSIVAVMERSMRRIPTLLVVLALFVLPAVVVLTLLVAPASSWSAPGAAQTEATTEPPLPCGPVTFPHGAISFADAVVDDQPAFTADTLPPEAVQDPQQALGPPSDVADSYVLEGHAVTLGSSGSLTRQFLDNVLTGDGTASPDLGIGDSGDQGSRHLRMGDGL